MSERVTARVTYDATTQLGGHGEPALWFNYRNERNERWTDPALQQQRPFKASLPAEGKQGVVIDIPARV